MLLVACSACKNKQWNTEPNAQRVSICLDCLDLTAKAPRPNDVWLDAERILRSVTRHAVTDDDDDEDDGKVSDKPLPKRKKTRDDDDEDDEPKSKKKKAKSKGGLNIGLILLIVGVLGCCICLPVVGIVIALTVPAVDKARGAAGVVETKNHMKEIGLALHNYNDVNRGFPSSRSAKADLSWRVDILPFAQQDALFNQFDKTRGFDQGQNAPLLNMRPKIYDSPLRPLPDKTQTPIQYFVGPGSSFTDAQKKPRLPQDFPDGTSNTILFAEARNPVPWSKAADMNLAPNGPVPVPDGLFFVCFADVSIRRANRAKLSDQQLRDLINPRDGKVTNFDLE